MKIIRFDELKKMLSISRSTIDRWVKSNNFPKKLHLGKNSIGWNYEEIIEWQKNKSIERE